jgi:hypothetical protein
MEEVDRSSITARHACERREALNQLTEVRGA